MWANRINTQKHNQNWKLPIEKGWLIDGCRRAKKKGEEDICVERKKKTMFIGTVADISIRNLPGSFFCLYNSINYYSQKNGPRY